MSRRYAVGDYVKSRVDGDPLTGRIFQVRDGCPNSDTWLASSNREALLGPNRMRFVNSQWTWVLTHDPQDWTYYQLFPADLLEPVDPFPVKSDDYRIYFYDGNPVPV